MTSKVVIKTEYWKGDELMVRNAGAVLVDNEPLKHVDQLLMHVKAGILHDIERYRNE
jgi:hypothetical protein